MEYLKKIWSIVLLLGLKIREKRCAVSLMMLERLLRQ